jgi:hypothetical protein
VRALIEQKNSAAASKPDMMIMDSDSEHDPTFPAEDADITDGDKKMAAVDNSDSEYDTTLPDEDADITGGDKKMAAVDKTPDRHRKEAAKVMASLQQTPTLYDTKRQEAHKELPKKANEAQSKK